MDAIEVLTSRHIIFDTIVVFAIIVSCFLVYTRTRELSKLSLQKGIKYYSTAFLFFILCFSLMYVDRLLNYFFQEFYRSALLISAAFGFFILYTGAIGGFYLAYSLMWRRFETDRIKRLHPYKITLLHITAAMIALADLYLIIRFNLANQYVFFSIMITVMLIATVISQSEHKKARTRGHPPDVNTAFLSSIGLAFGVYVGFFIENIIFSFLPTIHFYIWGIVMMFFVAVAYNVVSLAK